MDPAPASFEKSSVLTKHSQPAQATLTSRTAEIGTQPGGQKHGELMRSRQSNLLLQAYNRPYHTRRDKGVPTKNVQSPGIFTSGSRLPGQSQSAFASTLDRLAKPRKGMDVSHVLYRGYLEKMTEKESSYGPTQRV